MGAVFAAYDEQLDRKVALKLLHPTGVEQRAQRQRVLREAQALARVAHPNIVHVYDVGEVNGQIFIAMEYIAGMTLAAWQRERRSSRDVLRVYRQAGAGLLAVHQTGLVHRDFKPDNVLLDRKEHARVVDFGLARLLNSEIGISVAGKREGSASMPALRTPVTADDVIAGTPGYMAPEQYSGGVVDSRSDQFSFCVAVYEALYGCMPFAGDTVAEISANVLAGRLLPAPAATLVPIEVQRALLRGLAVDPNARFPTMAELLTALDVEEERDPAGARSARRIVSIVGVTVASIVALGTSIKATPRTVTAREMVIVGAAVAAAIHVGAMVFRRSLLANAFHRGLARLMQIAMGTVLGVRCLGLALNLDIAVLVPIDLMVMGGGIAAVAYQYLPAAWWLAAGLIAASPATVLWPQYALQIGNAGYLLLPIGITYLWSQAGSNRSRPSAAAAVLR